jgi:membrane dipeptidase
LRRGRVALCFATTLARATGHPVPHLDYATPLQAYAIAQGQLAYYWALEQAGHAQIVIDADGLDEHMAAWDASGGPGVAGSPPLGLVLSMEGADPVLEPDQLQEWWEAGVRIVGPAHYGPGRYAGGTGTESGLTDLGEHLLVEMERWGMLLDLTHLSDRAFWQALEQFGGPVLASHNNCRALVPHQRQFDDTQLLAVFERDGVIGAALDNWMLKLAWEVDGHGDDRVTLAKVVDHIDYICQLAGNSHHAAIGSDLDGGFGREQSPADLDTVADLQRLPEMFAERGYAAEDIAAIMHGNWVRLLRESWAGVGG